MGFLFTIIKTTNPEILDIVPSFVLKYDKGSYYIAAFTSDVQYMVGDDKSAVSYIETRKLSREFLRSFNLKETDSGVGKNYKRISEYMKEESIDALTDEYFIYLSGNKATGKIIITNL